MSPEEIRLPMPWGHVAAKTWGSPIDKRVLVVHGILDNAGSFDRLISLLPTGYYFVCIDLPGHGLSTHFPAGLPLDYFNYVLTIRKVLEHLKWQTCLYIGHSLGASVGLMFASLYPERVERILNIDAVTAVPISNKRLISHIRRVHDNTLSITEEGRAAKLYTEAEVMHMLMNMRYHTLNVAAAKALMKRSVTEVGDKYKYNRDPRLNNNIFPIFNYEQHLHIIKQLKVPVSFIFSSASMSANQNVAVTDLATQIKFVRKSSFTIVEGNHDVHNNHPERVAPHVVQFLTNLKSNL